MSVWLAALKKDWARAVSLGLVVAGLIVTGYLSWIKLANTVVLCTGVGDCESVNSSVYSVVMGIPVAFLGFGTYVVLGLLLAFENEHPQLQSYGPIAVFGLSFFGTLYSAYLTYIELFVIHAICPYCVVSAVLITVLWGLAIWRLLRPPTARVPSRQ